MKLAWLFFVLLMPLYAFAFVTVGGTIPRSTWSAGTYFVTENLNIPSGTDLTINPEVVVRIAPGVIISVLGSIHAGGGGSGTAGMALKQLLNQMEVFLDK